MIEYPDAQDADAVDAEKDESQAALKQPGQMVEYPTFWLVFNQNGTTTVIQKPRTSTTTSGSGAPRQGDPDLSTRNAFDAEQSQLQRDEAWRLFVEKMGMEKAMFNTRTGEEARQFNEKMGMDKSIFNQRQAVDQGGLTGYFGGAPTLDRDRLNSTNRQFDQTFPLREGEVTGYYKGANTLDRDKLGENAYQHSSNQAFEYYKRLQDMASNPRNFMLNFFQNRGQEAPANAKAYGNTSQRLSAMQSFEDFLPQFLSSQGRAYGRGTAAAGTQGLPTAQTAQTAQAPRAPFAGSSMPGGTDSTQSRIYDQRFRDMTPDGYAGMYAADAAEQQSTSEGYNPVSLAEKQALAAKYAAAGHSIPQLPDYAPTPTVATNPYGLTYNGGADPAGGAYQYKPVSYARGGVIPEPVVGRGMVSGRPYTFGEKGPEGVVPSNMLPDFLKRRGGTGSYALGGEIGYSTEPQPVYQAPNTEENPPYVEATYQAPNTEENPPYIAPEYQAPNIEENPPYIAPEYQAPNIEENPPYIAPVAPAPTPFTISPEQQAIMDATLQQTAQQNVQPTVQAPTTTLPQLAPAPQPTYAAPQPTYAAPQPTYTAPQTTQPVAAPVAAPAPPAPGYAPVQQPLQLPQGVGYERYEPYAEQKPMAPAPMAPVNTFTGQPQTNRDVASPGTFGRSIPGSGPQFLPGEDQTSLQALIASGALPPFLARIFGQQAGVQSVGTNQGQRFDLPPDVPVVSELALRQMAPTEREAFMSYISSYGIAPEDYLDYVRTIGPAGGPAQSPLFGANLRYNRQ